ncbi:DNA polymerase epsilon subunit 4 [Heracleum sosnowskyi]|uniref:DNA polymerase epsilon subunit 4 n=1 Tax=Heracleum sosnowskyi TaxID=360622 RepID=A0AAD8J6F7_9APIA|nr:DNA polymerase epsilon subunit 4 [Heracleum sosnowskyi]
MARKTLDSNSKRKAEEDVKKVADPIGDEVLSSMVTKKKRIETTGSNKNPKTSKKPEDSKKKVKKADKKVKFESPVKRSGKKDDVEVNKVKKSMVKKEENENGALYAFPMNRVTRIVKSENPDVKLSAEAAFLFNKASEKFLELFSKEAYACASKDGNKKIEYQHLASLIPGNTRFDFLSDFVPAKVKVADALKKIPSFET